MRSKLFVPGSRPELFAKAMATDADAISIDLEDSVPDERKGESREQVSAFLQSAETRNSRKTVIVRVNGPDTAEFEADLRAVARPGLALLNLPKVESVDHIRKAAAAVERAAAANGVTEPIGLLVTVETPAGLRRAAEIAAAHPRVAGLQVGYLDLFGSLGIDRRNSAAVQAVQFAVRMAAGEAGVFAYDGAFADVKDPDGFRRESEMARQLGYWGKSCIHPRQVAIANSVFQPSSDEIAEAGRIVEASRRARADGRGAFLLDGRMIDAPAIRRAEGILAASGTTRGR